MTWKTDLEDLRYGKQIAAMLESLFDDWMDDSDRDEFVDNVLVRTGLTMQSLDEQIQMGVDAGWTPEIQLGYVLQALNQ